MRRRPLLALPFALLACAATTSGPAKGPPGPAPKGDALAPKAEAAAPKGVEPVNERFAATIEDGAVRRCRSAVRPAICEDLVAGRYREADEALRGALGEARAPEDLAALWYLRGMLYAAREETAEAGHGAFAVSYSLAPSAAAKRALDGVPCIVHLQPPAADPIPSARRASALAPVRAGCTLRAGASVTDTTPLPAICTHHGDDASETFLLASVPTGVAALSLGMNYVVWGRTSPSEESVEATAVEGWTLARVVTAEQREAAIDLGEGVVQRGMVNSYATVTDTLFHRASGQVYRTTYVRPAPLGVPAPSPTYRPSSSGLHVEGLGCSGPLVAAPVR